MLRLGEIGVPTHFVRRLNMREQLIKEVEIIPVEVVVRNVAAGSLARASRSRRARRCPARSSSTTTSRTSWAIPLVSEEHITAFGWASYQELDEILNLTLRINDYLTGLFIGVGLKLVDFKVEFGRLWEEEDMRIVLADEISPDNCRLWDIAHQREARQGPLPPRPRQRAGGLCRDRAPARHPARGRPARPEGAGDGAVRARVEIAFRAGRARPARRRRSARRWSGLGFAGVREVRADQGDRAGADGGRPGRGRGRGRRRCASGCWRTR